jgi:hypothetical protein
MYALDEFRQDLGEVPYSVDRVTLRAKSRDHFAVSPLLRGALSGKVADIVVSPRGKDEIRAVVQAAVRYSIPITLRGGGTANYGQCVPLHGGILLDMTGMAGVLWVRQGQIRALAGTLVSEMDTVARAQGVELRLHPSTKSTATIAGFVAGGSGGMGSCMWGMLRDRGNITGLEVLSVEEEPRVIELRGRDVEIVHHAYGTNAIITEVEMPAAPAWGWRETIVAFPDFLRAARFGIQLAREIAIVKKLISLQERPVARLMSDLGGVVPDGQSMVNCLIADGCVEAFDDLVADYGGRVVSSHAEGQGPYGAPLYEFAYGHSLKQLQKADAKYTALQGLFPYQDLFATIERVHRSCAGAMPMRLEIFRSEGEIVAMGSPYILYESEQQMAYFVRCCKPRASASRIRTRPACARSASSRSTSATPCSRHRWIPTACSILASSTLITRARNGRRCRRRAGISRRKPRALLLFSPSATRLPLATCPRRRCFLRSSRRQAYCDPAKPA